MICLCLAHEYLGSVGEGYVYALSVELMAPWAGERIICLGDYARNDDYPDAVQLVIQSWKKAMDAALSGKESTDSKKRYPDFRTHMLGTCRQVDGKDDIVAITDYYNLRHIEVSLTPADKAKCSKLLAGLKTINKFPSERESVLCNISKRVFVRGDAIKDLHNYCQERTNPRDRSPYYGISFAQAMLSQMCWSSDPTCAMALSDSDCERLTRGPWAGDRLEIVTRGILLQRLEWRDVTEEVCNWLEKLWKDSGGC